MVLTSRILGTNVRAEGTAGGRIPLTIAVPAYNRVGCVKSLLRSICAQAEDVDELIVSDDGSTDGTVEQISVVPGVRVIRHPTNQGMVANWNACLSAATRDWICIIHDDDRLEPGALDALRRACVLANGPALIQHQYAGSQFNGGFRYTFTEPSSGAVLSCPFIPSGAVLHRAIIETVGLFNPRFKYSADLEFFPRIAARFPLMVIESPRIVEYRRHGANYHFQTAHKDDFYVQYEEILRTIISYAGIENETRGLDFVEGRMVGDMLYMLDIADRMGNRGLVRRIGSHLARFRHRLTPRQRVITSIAAVTGWRPRRHKAEPFGPLPI